MRGNVFGTRSAAWAMDSGYTLGLLPYVSYVRIPFDPTNTPPPPSPRGSVTSSGRNGGRAGMRPPSYQYTFTAGCAGVLPTAGRSGNSYCTIVASGYVAGFCAPPPHGVDDADTLVGYVRFSAQNTWSMRCAPMSPMAPTPKSTQPRQLNGWYAG